MEKRINVVAELVKAPCRIELSVEPGEDAGVRLKAEGKVVDLRSLFMLGMLYFWRHTTADFSRKTVKEIGRNLLRLYELVFGKNSEHITYDLEAESES